MSTMTCPFCRSKTEEDALVCATCSRDITVPPALLAERDDLLRKCEATRNELAKALAGLEMIRNRGRQRLH